MGSAFSSPAAGAEAARKGATRERAARERATRKDGPRVKFSNVCSQEFPYNPEDLPGTRLVPKAVEEVVKEVVARAVAAEAAVAAARTASRAVEQAAARAAKRAGSPDCVARVGDRGLFSLQDVELKDLEAAMEAFRHEHSQSQKI